MIAADPLLLFRDDSIRENFFKFGLNEIKKRFICPAIPPHDAYTAPTNIVEPGGWISHTYASMR